MKKSLIHLYVLIGALSVLFLLPLETLQAQTSFIKHSGNPILPLGSSGEWDSESSGFVSVLSDGATYHMWYTGVDQAETYRIGYATSSDGLTWNKDATNPVLDVSNGGAFDDQEVWAPTVLYDGSQYKMWYSGNFNAGGIGYAFATNPTEWTRHGTAPVLARGGTGSWDQVSVFNPIVMYNGSLYQMWYSGRSGQTGLWQTGYATSTDGITWEKHSNNPVLTVGAANEWDAAGAVAGSVLYVDGEYQMWYHGSGNAGTVLGNDVGYATSPDGVNWTKHAGNPILQRDAGTWDAANVWFPRVIKEGNIYRMWYTGRTNDELNRLGYAEGNIVDAIEVLDNTQPANFQLKQNYPNPFNPTTNIEFRISHYKFVELTVLDISGRLVKTLVNENRQAGAYATQWDATNEVGEKVASGVYFYRLKTGSFLETRKMLLIR